MARTVATELKGDEETAFEHCPHPGASLVGRPVRKLFEDPEVPEEFRRYHGAVTGVRPHDTFQQVYVVRYDDGEEEELTFEELMPVLEGSLEGTVPRDVLDSAGRMSFSRVKLLRAGIGKGNTFRGVHAGTDAMGRHGFIGCVTDDSGIEHCFAFTFPIRAELLPRTTSSCDESSPGRQGHHQAKLSRRLVGGPVRSDALRGERRTLPTAAFASARASADHGTSREEEETGPEGAALRVRG